MTVMWTRSIVSIPYKLRPWYRTCLSHVLYGTIVQYYVDTILHGTVPDMPRGSNLQIFCVCVMKRKDYAWHGWIWYDGMVHYSSMIYHTLFNGK